MTTPLTHGVAMDLSAPQPAAALVQTFPPDAPSAEQLDEPTGAVPDDELDDDAGDQPAPPRAVPISLDAQLDALQARRTSAEIKRIRTEIGPIVAERFRQARELCGLSQLEASPLLGYQKSTQLSLIEGGLRTAPLWLLIRASQVYAVSLDWLAGLTDEPEQDPRGRLARSVTNSITPMMQAMTDALVGSTVLYVESLTPLIPNVERIEASVRLLRQRAERMRELNDCWPDLAAGAPFEASLAQLAADVDALVRETRSRANSAALTARAMGRAARTVPSAHGIADLLERVTDPLSAQDKLAA